MCAALCVLPGQVRPLFCARIQIGTVPESRDVFVCVWVCAMAACSEEAVAQLVQVPDINVNRPTDHKVTPLHCAAAATSPTLVRDPPAAMCIFFVVCEYQRGRLCRLAPPSFGARASHRYVSS